MPLWLIVRSLNFFLSSPPWSILVTKDRERVMCALCAAALLVRSVMNSFEEEEEEKEKESSPLFEHRFELG